MTDPKDAVLAIGHAVAALVDQRIEDGAPAGIALAGAAAGLAQLCLEHGDAELADEVARTFLDFERAARAKLPA